MSKLSFRLSKEEKNSIRDEADSEGKSMGEYIRDLIFRNGTPGFSRDSFEQKLSDIETKSKAQAKKKLDWYPQKDGFDTPEKLGKEIKKFEQELEELKAKDEELEKEEIKAYKLKRRDVEKGQKLLVETHEKQNDLRKRKHDILMEKTALEELRTEQVKRSKKYESLVKKLQVQELKKLEKLIIQQVEVKLDAFTETLKVFSKFQQRWNSLQDMESHRPNFSPIQGKLAQAIKDIDQRGLELGPMTSAATRARTQSLLESYNVNSQQE